MTLSPVPDLHASRDVYETPVARRSRRAQRLAIQRLNSREVIGLNTVDIAHKRAHDRIDVRLRGMVQSQNVPKFVKRNAMQIHRAGNQIAAVGVEMISCIEDHVALPHLRAARRNERNCERVQVERIAVNG